MLIAIVLICVCLLGYLVQTTGLCMVRGINEWKAGNKEFLLAILFSGILAWVAILFAHYEDIPLKFRTYQISGWFIFGGLLFGICVVVKSYWPQFYSKASIFFLTRLGLNQHYTYVALSGCNSQQYNPLCVV